MTDPAQIARSLTKAQKVRIIEAKWHQYSNSWRPIVSGKLEQALRNAGLIDARVFPALTALGIDVRMRLLLEALETPDA